MTVPSGRLPKLHRRNSGTIPELHRCNLGMHKICQVASMQLGNCCQVASMQLGTQCSKQKHKNLKCQNTDQLARHGSYASAHIRQALGAHPRPFGRGPMGWAHWAQAQWAEPIGSRPMGQTHFSKRSVFVTIAWYDLVGAPRRKHDKDM